MLPTWTVCAVFTWLASVVDISDILLRHWVPLGQKQNVSVRGVRRPRGLNQGYLMLGQPVEGRVVCAYRTQCFFFKLGANFGKIENRQAGFISEAALELYGRHL